METSFVHVSLRVGRTHVGLRIGAWTVCTYASNDRDERCYSIHVTKK
jgi:hypothetical protein